MKFRILSFLVFLSMTGFAQLNFRNISFSDALIAARQENKLIFLQFESSECELCNETADKGMNSAEVVKKIDATFIPIKITAVHPDRSLIDATYDMKGFGSLFIDFNGALIHSYHRTSSNPKSYLDEIDLALSKTGEILKVDELERQYRASNSYGMLELLLEKRKSLNLSVDKLLDEYIDVVPADSISSPNVLRFVMEMAPTFGSKAFAFVYKDRELFSKTWSSLPLQKRIAINSTIIYRSMSKAIAEKNQNYAFSVAAFARGTYAPGSVSGSKSFEYNLLRFNKETNDTARYLRSASAYYQTYLMSIRPDSVKQLDSMNLKKLFNAAARTDSIVSGNKVTYKKSVAYSPVAQVYAQQLNQGAWYVYKMTKDPTLLAIATTWAQRATEFYDSPEVLDTYARLLYKTGNKTEAIATEERALLLRQKRQYPTKAYSTVIEKMKNGQEIE